MKMAKADEADLNMAMELSGALDSLTGWIPAVPDAVAKTESDDDYERFDRDNREQCVRVLNYLLDVADRASLMRVVWGAAVMLDPNNKLVDPAAETIEHHPETLAALKDAERYRKLRDENEWGEDVAIGCGSAWEMLGELHGENFDRFVDARFPPPKNGD